MNILIIADYYPPINSVASVRLAKLVKYMSGRSDFSVTVAYRKPRPFELIDTGLICDVENADKGIPVSDGLFFRIGFYALAALRKNKRSAKRSTEKLSAVKREDNNDRIEKQVGNTKGFHTLVDRMYCAAFKSYANRAKKKIAKLKIKYDVVVSSYPQESSVLIGNYVKGKQIAKRWICDLRDPIRSNDGTGYIAAEIGNKLLQECLSMAAANADCIVGVCESCLAGFEARKDDCRIITNGFDRDDIHDISFESDKKFTLTYAGTLYESKQDLRTILRALRELIDEGMIEKNDIELGYAGASSFIFSNWLEEYGLTDIADVHGLVTRTEALRLQLGSSMLMHASYRGTDLENDLASKIYEYMLISKPVISAVSGNLAGSQAKEIIEAANIGIACEAANGEADFLRLRDYILMQYNRWKSGEPLEYSPDINYVEEFNYKNITQKYADLIETVCKKEYR